MLGVSRECLGRTYALSLTWRWTDEDKYADKAVDNLLAVCGFEDWNPSHFLDTAEMSHAVAIGYDWLYHYMDEETRTTVRAALVNKGLGAGIEAYHGGGPSGGWWAQVDHNWNQVCNSGLMIAALAVAESEPNDARFVLERARQNILAALECYVPDGAWPEGPGYWDYATTYTACGLAALRTALGTDFGLSGHPGLSQTGNFPIYTAGPTQMFLNFADSGDRASRRPSPCMFWLGRTYENSLFSENEHAVLATGKTLPHHVIWYVPPATNRCFPEDLDRCFGGPVEVAVFRSAWNDPNALFVGVKGGDNQVNHGHLDLGSFELDALGVRWARDLGSDRYGLPGYFEEERGGRRWSYYRMRSASHNVCMPGGEDQDPLAKARFTGCAANTESPYAIVDLTEAYRERAEKALRGVAMVAGRRAVLVQDEFTLSRPCEVLWGMTTDAEIRVESASVARLTLGGNELLARLLTPGEARFSVESAEQSAPQRTNTGVRRLVATTAGTKGSVRIAVLLSPVWPEGGAVETTEVQPLSNWE
jgi:hypothetical protein